MFKILISNAYCKPSFKRLLDYLVQYSKLKTYTVINKSIKITLLRKGSKI